MAKEQNGKGGQQGFDGIDVKKQDMMYEMIRMAAVLHIAALKERGGPTADDMKRVQETSDILGEHGDILIYGGGKPRECADQFNRVAHAIAVLSFAPGGLDIFGGHFEAWPKPDDSATEKEHEQTPEGSK